MTDPHEIVDLGTLLSEASQQGPARSIVSAAPQSVQPLQNPMGQTCVACGHQIVEKDCPIHENNAPFAYFSGFNPAGYYHQRCLQKMLDDRARQLREQYGNPQVQEARR